MIKKLAPVLIVDRIEPLLPLWEALGFRRTAEVPHGEALGFVILDPPRRRRERHHPRADVK